MSSVIAFVFLFGAFAALVGGSLLLAPENGADNPSQRGPVADAGTPTAVATSTVAVLAPTATSTPIAPLNDEPPGRYMWVMLLEIAPPGEEFPTIITKRDGGYVAPDRRSEIAGGTTGDGEAWNKFAAQVGDQAWQREGGPTPTWTPLDEVEPALLDAGMPPYWHLVEASDGVLESTEPVREGDHYIGEPVLRYELTLAQLPGLTDYLSARLRDSLPETDAGALLPVAVNYWLRASDNRPVQIQIFPQEEVLPDVDITFNIYITNIDDPAIVIEDPASQP